MPALKRDADADFEALQGFLGHIGAQTEIFSFLDKAQATTMPEEPSQDALYYIISYCIISYHIMSYQVFQSILI